ncbi:isoprenyl transferase [candidate division LCP-89 bacterium B3_LCP]|uniref:Isoprenyl transferase n=1 Tax=candidate division LCP-89 bacterium B3_LCP TaxID=2012998 RepID=A0A532UXY9_UNCL8|nr:MAG: isoprenyl transferase [candidate division LCP-89 bacterium B3_LCP]
MKNTPAEIPAIDADKIPQHIAIIMDGNGRWAKQRYLPRIAGHREGINSVREIVKTCGELGIKVLTLYTFSSENWSRPATEVSALMKLLLVTINREVKDLNSNNVKLKVIGNIDDLPDQPRSGMQKAIEKLKSNTGLILNLALSYGGRQEIMEAVRQICREGREGITEKEFSQYLYTADLPDPELLIRTSGELRLSNFLLWQLAYTEIYVTDTLWPDFRTPELHEAIRAYQKRERRFGKVSEQLSSP